MTNAKRTTGIAIFALLISTGVLLAWKLGQTNNQLTDAQTEISQLRNVLSKRNQTITDPTNKSTRNPDPATSACPAGVDPEFTSVTDNDDGLVSGHWKIINGGQVPKAWNISVDGEPQAYEYYDGREGAVCSEIAAVKMRRPDWATCHAGACDGGGADISIDYIKRASMKSFLAKEYSAGDSNGVRWETTKVDGRDVKVRTYTDEGKDMGVTTYYLEDFEIQITGNRGDLRVKSDIDHFIKTLDLDLLKAD